MADKALFWSRGRVLVWLADSWVSPAAEHQRFGVLEGSWGRSSEKSASMRESGAGRGHMQEAAGMASREPQVTAEPVVGSWAAR